MNKSKPTKKKKNFLTPNHITVECCCVNTSSLDMGTGWESLCNASMERNLKTGQ